MMQSTFSLPATTMVNDSSSLRNSKVYRSRLTMTVVALLLGWGATLVSPVLYPEGTFADNLCDGTAWGLLFLGLAIRAWASRALSGRKEVMVVDYGPYALCRNPLYWGTFLLACSQLMILRNPAFLLLVVILTMMYVYGVVPAEERVMQSKLGKPYVDYCQQVHRFLPMWNSRVLVQSQAGCHPAFRRELMSMLVWITLPVAAEIICFVRDRLGHH